MNLRTPINYGFFVALSSTILMVSLVGLDMLGPDAIRSGREMIGGTLLFLMIYLFLLAGVYFVMKQAKDRNGSMLSFKEALLLGVSTSFSSALFSVFFTVLFYEVAFPDYVSELMAAMQEQMELEKIPTDRINEKLVERRGYYGTVNQSLFSFIGNLITGAAFTLLLGFFLKQNPKQNG